MAFSSFLRNPGISCAFSQQLTRLSSLTLTQRTIASLPSIRSLDLKPSTTPMLNSIRSVHTSPVCLSAEKPHDHSKMWVIEKGVSAALVPLIPIALLLPNKLFDCALAILITAHSFWGLEAVAVDYVRASIFGPIIPKIAIALVYLLSIATLGGLFYIITHDIGIAHTVRQIWAIKSDGQKA